MQDPAFRAQVLSEAPSAELLNRLSQFRQHITTRWNRMFPMADPPNYEPEEKDSIAAIAARSNHSPDEVAYDYLAGGADRFLFFPIVGYNEDNLDVIHTMLSDETHDPRVVGWRRALLLHRRCQRAELDADPLGARPQPRAEAAAGDAGEAADQRHGAASSVSTTAGC